MTCVLNHWHRWVYNARCSPGNIICCHSCSDGGESTSAMTSHTRGHAITLFELPRSPRHGKRGVIHPRCACVLLLRVGVGLVELRIEWVCVRKWSFHRFSSSTVWEFGESLSSPRSSFQRLKSVGSSSSVLKKLVTWRKLKFGFG